MLEGIEKLVIIGTGLLGASLGLSLKASGYTGRIIGVARRPEVAQTAMDLGTVDETSLDPPSAASDADLIVVAVPLGAFASVFQAIADTPAVITDVGSTKASVVQLAQEHLSQPDRFVGAHPMAGSEQQGPEAATADLLAGKPCILTPADNADANAITLVEALWSAVDMSLIRMDPEEHDQKMAAVSHLPHLAAVALINLVAELGGWEVASTGLRDTTRLASSNPPMRADIIHENHRALVPVLRAYANRIQQQADLIETDSRPPILSLLDNAKQQRDTWIESRES
ncbi:prephenate dehydrogenase [Mucisphaera sp.]|uniref:prephenate dehydrogenase n=1 Tax=Mucisphaera sp. TaxID=2913024 RepID=UPI003D109D2F